MTKSKSQLRAEAVERLRKLNCMDVDCYQLLEATVDDAGEKVGYRVEISKLIDMLTDDETCPNSNGTCPHGDRTPSIEQGDDGVAKLDAQARAEIEDAERSANAAESHGDAPESALGSNTDTDKGENAETTETKPNSLGDLFGIWKERKKISPENAEIFDNQSELGHDAENYSPDSREKFESDMDKGEKVAQTARWCADDEIIYGFEFCGEPDSTMLGETVFDSVGEPIGWIVPNGKNGDFLPTTAEDEDANCKKADSLQDSREMLEADVSAWIANEMGVLAKYGIEDAVLQQAVFEWLDRQAAITKMEMQAKMDARRDNDGTCPDADRTASVAQDSRERLEAEIRYEYNGRIEWEADQIIGWLDRQAAITQDETIHDYNIAARESGRILRDEIAELQADRDELQRQLGTMRDVTREFRDERDEWKAKAKKLDCEVREWKGEAKTQRNNFYQATEARKHWQRKYENLKAMSYSAEAPSDESELARELGKALAERDMYREKLGRAIDAAHEIARMMEVER